jgi:hypoxanthine phosphoribosyltransferase
MQHYKDILAEILIDEETLQARIKELGEQISAVMDGNRSSASCAVRPVHHRPPSRLCSGYRLSYRVGKRESSGGAVSLDLQTDIRDKDVLLVEDIVDSGHTIASMLKLLQLRQPRSLRVCALLDKAERREANVPIHYRGFDIPNKFVFGFGLDLDEYYRNLPFVGVVDLKKYKPPS